MSYRVPFCDLEAALGEADAELRDAVLRVVASRRYVLGPEVERFEADVARYLGAGHAVGVSSGTDALVMALLAVGVGAGDEVVTTPLSFVATAEAILRVGAVPRFVDVDASSLCLDVARVEQAMTPRVRAILPVHLFGRAAAVRDLVEVARRHDVPLVEDAAQAFGTRQGGRALGTSGKVGCFSFFPTKVLGALGDAGLAVTDDPGLAAELRSLRQHGLAGSGRYARLGGNFRMDALQAAALSVMLPHVDSFLGSRRAIAARYDAALGALPGLVLRGCDPDTEWNGAVYTVRVSGGHRDALLEHLARSGVEARVYYDTPLHLQPLLAGLGHRPGAFPVAERAVTEVLSLPIYPGLADASVGDVIAAVYAFFDGR